MKILPERSIENNVYTTIIKPLEFGDATYTADEEIEILKDTPQTLRYSDIDFSDTFVIKNKIPVISDEDGAVPVNLELNNKEFAVDENLELTLSVNANNIADTELDGTVFLTKQELAMAKVILYETKVIERLKTLLDTARSHVTTFEQTVEQTL